MPTPFFIFVVSRLTLAVLLFLQTTYFHLARTAAKENQNQNHLIPIRGSTGGHVISSLERKVFEFGIRLECSFYNYPACLLLRYLGLPTGKRISSGMCDRILANDRCIRRFEEAAQNL